MSKKKHISPDEHRVLNTVRNNIRTVSTSMGWSLRETANAADVDWSTFSDFMTGKTHSSNTITIIRIAFALKLTVSEIFAPDLVINNPPLTTDWLYLNRASDNSHVYTAWAIEMGKGWGSSKVFALQFLSVRLASYLILTSLPSYHTIKSPQHIDRYRGEFPSTFPHGNSATI